MKQRLGLASALLGSPELVVLDEPTTGLDPQGIKEVRDLIAGLASTGNVTVFLSSHLLPEIEQVATSMAIINRGALIVQGRVQELLGGESGSVRLRAAPVDRALEIIRTLPFAGEARAEGDDILVQIPSARAGALNAELVKGGVEVRSLIPQRSLEEYFLSLTGGEGGL